MAIIEGVGDSSVFLAIIVLAALLWMLKLAYDLKKAIIQKSKMLDTKVSSLESRAVSIRREVVDLHKVINQKLDKEEFEKRIDGLIALVGKKKEAERKKDAR
ncbi:MAG: hypothetical protein V1835_05990 [Candidatus Micrarchaeota archaeon]